ncbi:sigma-70 family RNA polymerase sigma factor [Opitutus sp. ER46]|uniref:sigma-70 family RNA polymerase sigma factor n=1 Tax=Opitutus sp. ER46 TaxID=2161864 RepID=UPI000D325FD2|nr:sigma-70 family RNA polymerase sigma factor [Opitutus sp. ER46]PTX91226.1 hypothetical protein DB354_21580 [Opitutus sp. ER46]
MRDDTELLRCYAEQHSEPAFAEFVSRHVGLVYAAARRRTGDDTLAQDAAQQVFTSVARQAATLARHPSLAGWLYTATKHASLNLLRTERRRLRRETIAYQMHASEPPGLPAVAWEQLRPALDAAMDALNAADREAVLLRYFENRPLAVVAAQLGTSENAARMRVNRALDRLHVALSRRGVTSTTSALAAVLTLEATAAPAGLATTMTQAALAAAATTAGGTLGGSLLGLFAMNKLTLAATALVIAGALAPTLWEWHKFRGASAELADREQLSASVRHEAAALSEQVTKLTSPDQTRVAELRQLQARAATLQARPAGVLDSAMRPPTNAGTATAEATFETMLWAVTTGDWELFAQNFVLEGDALAQAQALFDSAPPEIRTRFKSPQGLVAHVWVDGSRPKHVAWAERIQVLDSVLADGPATRRVRIWQRTGDGKEMANIAEFERRGERWIISPTATAKALQVILPRIDPTTGGLKPRKPGDS